MWKNKNKSLIESTEDSQLKYDLGIVLVNLMVELKLIKLKLKILSRTEKRNILVPGDRLEKLIASSNSAPVIISLPHKLPMFVKPNLYLYKDSNSTPHSAVQPCSHKIVAGLAGYSLKQKVSPFRSVSWSVVKLGNIKALMIIFN
jgi:hypothetical protein